MDILVRNLTLLRAAQGCAQNIVIFENFHEFKLFLKIGCSGGVPSFLAGYPLFYRCARSIENLRRIKMVVARASGTDLASSLKQNTFLIEKKAGCPSGISDGVGRGGPGAVLGGPTVPRVSTVSMGQ